MTALDFVWAFIIISVALSVLMTVAWLIQQRTGNSGWVDTVWTFSVGLVGFVGALVPGLSSGLQPRQIIVAAFAIIWALRLGSHIAHRSTGIIDDPRYAKMIRDWGSEARVQMFWLLQKQAWVSIPLVFAMFLAAHHPGDLRVQDFVAVAVLVIAIVGEALADHQLRQFKSSKSNKGKINDRKLWSWSRHPNYFFEWFGWLAYPLLAIDVSGGYSVGWIALVAPACMYWLLVYISGIPPLEEHMLKTRGKAFRAYQQRTNAFFPAPPRVSS
jgi:steroid 5-alpha reductase family enzyme